MIAMSGMLPWRAIQPFALVGGAAMHMVAVAMFASLTVLPAVSVRTGGEFGWDRLPFLRRLAVAGARARSGPAWSSA